MIARCLIAILQLYTTFSLIRALLISLLLLTKDLINISYNSLPNLRLPHKHIEDADRSNLIPSDSYVLRACAQKMRFNTLRPLP